MASITIDTSLDDLLERAKSEIKNLQKDEEFIVKDLFPGYEWNRLKSKKSRKLRLGRSFGDFAQTPDGAALITILDKTSNSQQKYRKL